MVKTPFGFLVLVSIPSRNDNAHEDDRDGRHYQGTADEVESASEVSGGPVGRADHVRSSEATERAKRIDESDRRGCGSAGKEGCGDAPQRRFGGADAECGEGESGDRQESRRPGASG